MFESEERRKTLRSGGPYRLNRVDLFGKNLRNFYGHILKSVGAMAPVPTFMLNVAMSL